MIHHGDEWYQFAEGAPTGNLEVPSVANIYIKYLVDKKISSHVRNTPFNRMNRRARFLDDIWSVRDESDDSFILFLQEFNKIGGEYGVIFAENCVRWLNFLM